MLLDRDDWYGVAHDLDWSLSDVEHGFTNMQFFALAADAMGAGEVGFSSLLSRIQTGEAGLQIKTAEFSRWKRIC